MIKLIKFTDRPVLAVRCWKMSSEELSPEVVAELRAAWKNLGGKTGSMPTKIAGHDGLYEAFARLDAGPNLLSIIGSIGNGITDDAAVKFIKAWNAIGPDW